MGDELPEELQDRWILDLRGNRVEQVTRIPSGEEVIITVDSGAQIRIGANAWLSSGPVRAPGAVPLRVAEASDDELQALVGTHILSAVAFKTGSLRVVFSSGYHLNTRLADLTTFVQVTMPNGYEWSNSGLGGSMVFHDREC
jgi:hypothetical protein